MGWGLGIGISAGGPVHHGLGIGISAGGPVHHGLGIGISAGRVKRWHAANRRIRHHPPVNFDSCSTG